MKLLTDSRLKAIVAESYNQGLKVGRGLGRIEGLAEGRNMGCILGSQLERDVDKILREQKF
jgi:hypothetical protein